MDSEKLGSDVVSNVVSTAKTVGGQVKQAIIWNKVIEIAKFAIIIVVILIVVYFIYKIIMRRKK